MGIRERRTDSATDSLELPARSLLPLPLAECELLRLPVQPKTTARSNCRSRATLRSAPERCYLTSLQIPSLGYWTRQIRERSPLRRPAQTFDRQKSPAAQPRLADQNLCRRRQSCSKQSPSCRGRWLQSQCHRHREPRANYSTRKASSYYQERPNESHFVRWAKCERPYS